MKDNWIIQNAPLFICRWFNISLNSVCSSPLRTSVYETVNEDMICGDVDRIACGESTSYRQHLPF